MSIDRHALRLAVDQAKRARLGDEVSELAWCAKCQTGKPRREFPASAFRPSSQQGSRWCRACNAENKRRHRQRTARPCVGCGRPCGRENFNRRCWECWNEKRRGSLPSPTITPPTEPSAAMLESANQRGENRRCA